MVEEIFHSDHRSTSADY